MCAAVQRRTSPLTGRLLHGSSQWAARPSRSGRVPGCRSAIPTEGSDPTLRFPPAISQPSRRPWGPSNPNQEVSVSRIRSKLVTAAAVAAALGGGAVAANAATTTAQSSTGSSSSSAPQARHTVNGKTEQPLTGDVAAKVRAAALAKVAGTVERVETNVDSSAPYEAHIRRSDGTEVEVQVNKDYSVAAVNEMGGRHP